MTSWPERTIWWHVYPIGFFGAEKNALPPENDAIPRLRNIEPWLKYLLELGCNGILLAPVFASSTHGYDTVDHFKIDARLGDNEDFQWLSATCKSHGIRLVLDGVFNHVGRQFGHFQDVRTHRQSSRYADWFRIDWHNTHNEDGFGYKNFEGHGQLVALNHDNPEVLQYVVDVAKHWVRMGADGWRLDAAYAIPPHFLQALIARTKEEFPEAWFLAEIIHGDYANVARQTGLDSITQYELWKAIWSSLNDRNFFELKHALSRNEQFAASFVPNIFLGNHDVTRIITQLKEPRHLDLAMTLLFTIPGIPSVYAGDEQGYAGKKEQRAGGDDIIRPAYPADPSGLAQEGWEVFARYQAMIRFRKSNDWITRAHVNIQTLKNTFLIYEVIGTNNKVVVALNCGDDSVRLDVSNFGAKTVGNKSDPSLIEPHSAVIWYNS